MERTVELVEVRRPLTGDLGRKHQALLAEIAEATAQGEVYEADLAQAQAGEADEQTEQASQRLEESSKQLRKLQRKLEKLEEERLITLAFQEGAARHRMAHFRHLTEIQEWRREQVTGIWKDDNESDKEPTDEQMGEVETPGWLIDSYLALVDTAALSAAVVPEQCKGIEVPDTLGEWADLPSWLVEPAIQKVYELNRSWQPAWHLEPKEEEAKND